MKRIWSQVQDLWETFTATLVGAGDVIRGFDVEQFSARYEFSFTALSAIAMVAAVVVALWLARRLTRRRAVIAVAVVGEDEDDGPIRDRNMAVRISNTGHVPIFVGHRGFALRTGMGAFRRETTRGVASPPPGVGLSAMQNLEIPPGASRVVKLRRVGDFISAKDGALSRWRKRRTRFRVELQTGERFKTRLSRYELAQLRDSVREENQPEQDFAEVDLGEVEPVEKQAQSLEANNGSGQPAHQT